MICDLHTAIQYNYNPIANSMSRTTKSCAAQNSLASWKNFIILILFIIELAVNKIIMQCL